MPIAPSKLQIRMIGRIAAALVVLAAGVGGVLKLAVDGLLHWDAVAAAESWARYVAENVVDIDDIAGGASPTAESMQFFIRSQQIRHVFGFEIIDLNGQVQLSSDGSRIVEVHGAVHNATAVQAATSGTPIVAVKEGTPPIRPYFYSEAYLPVVIDGKPQAIVAAYVDLTEQHHMFQKIFLLAALALCLLTGIAVGFPTVAWYRRTKEKQRADERVHFLALHDALTGLANRPNLIDRLHGALADLPPGGAAVALHFIDLDRFKEVNDGFGHDAGDLLLKSIAARLRIVVDRYGEVARLGGDEFVAVQSNVRTKAQAEAFAHRIAAALSAPVRLREQEIIPTASIGIAIAPVDGTDPEQLLKSADLALYKSKADGRNCIRFFTPEMDADLRARVQLEKTLREAVANDDFVLHYQPIVGLPDCRLVGFEALVRMPSGHGTFVPPGAFIPLAEDLRLIDKIGAWVLREACRTAATWPERMRIAVNLSPIQVSGGRIARTVADALTASGLPAHRLELEITESLMLGDSESVIAELRELKAMGVAIVMDDFGTGYSSLGYLWRFPFDKLKIDRSFMLGLDKSAQDAETVIKTIIALGRELNMLVAVEGVENAAQVAFLRAAEAHQAQGFLLGRPAPADDIAARMIAEVHRPQAHRAPRERETVVRLAR
jgi:diguanylate cyclase (GGDEF)-like protein